MSGDDRQQTGADSVPEALNAGTAEFAQQPHSHTQPLAHKVHHSYIWLGSLRAIGVLLFVVIVTQISSVISLFSYIASTPGIGGILGIWLPIIGGLLVIVVVSGVVFAVHALAYKHLYYVVGDEEFSLYSGIITKKRVHVPYQKIQSVDQKASLLQRIFGVCNVSIDTAGGASNKAILVPYLTKQQADALRVELFARKQASGNGAVGSVAYASPQQRNTGAVTSTLGVNAGSVAAANIDANTAEAQSGNVLDAGDRVWNEIGGVFAGNAVDVGKVTFEYRLSSKELVFTGLSNSSSFAVAIIVALAAILQFAGGLFDFFPASEDLVTDTFVTSATTYGVEAVVAFSISAIVVIALVVWGISALSACISFGGFHACRRGDRVEIERGLLQHQTQSVNVERIQSVIVKQTFIRRLIGYCEISLGKVDAQDSDSSSNQAKTATTGGIIIHPFVKKARVSEILNGLVPEFADIPDDDRRLAKVALRRGIIRNCIWQGAGFWVIVLAVVGLAVLGFAESYSVSAVVSDFASDFSFDAQGDSTIQLMEIILWIVIALGIVGIILAAVRTVLWSKSSSFAFNRHFMRITNGGFSTESVTFPKPKIQYGFTKTNPLQRHAKTATINARTAAGIGGTTTRLIDVCEEDANQWLDWLR